MDSFGGLFVGFGAGVLLGSLIWKSEIYRGPDSSQIRKQIYLTDKGKCIKLTPNAVVGPIIDAPVHSHRKSVK